jgi:hypothetical protein
MTMGRDLAADGPRVPDLTQQMQPTLPTVPVGVRDLRQASGNHGYWVGARVLEVRR